MELSQTPFYILQDKYNDILSTLYHYLNLIYNSWLRITICWGFVGCNHCFPFDEYRIKFLLGQIKNDFDVFKVLRMQKYYNLLTFLHLFLLYLLFLQFLQFFLIWLDIVILVFLLHSFLFYIVSWFQFSFIPLCLLYYIKIRFRKMQFLLYHIYPLYLLQYRNFLDFHHWTLILFYLIFFLQFLHFLRFFLILLDFVSLLFLLHSFLFYIVSWFLFSFILLFLLYNF